MWNWKKNAILIVLGLAFPSISLGFQTSILANKNCNVVHKTEGFGLLRMSAENAEISRKKFLVQNSVISSAIFSLTTQKTLADSTGKFSSKATAKRRYLPRITNGIATLKTLKEPIEKGNWAPIESFLGEPLDDLSTAMSLYASSQKRGEYPDANSRARAKEVEDFTKILKKLPSLKKTKDTGVALKKYEEALAILSSFLANLELPPLDSEEYILSTSESA